MNYIVLLIIVGIILYIVSKYDKKTTVEGEEENKQEKIEWITLLNFTYPNEAYLAKSRLEADGILVFLKNEKTIQVDPLLSNALGGVKLQVPDYQYDEALEILKELGYIDKDYKIK